METNLHIMKKQIFTLKKVAGVAILGCLLAIGVSSCKKDNEASSVTDEETAELTVQALATNTGGLSLQASATVSLAAYGNLNCGASKDTTLTRQITVGQYSYNYSYAARKALVCTGTTPSTFTLSFDGTSAYSSPRLSSNDKAAAMLSVSGLSSSDSQYNLTGTYTRNGQQQIKVGEQKTFNSTIGFNLNNVKLDKITKQIVSGTATVQLVIVGSEGGAATKNVSITFLGGGKATIIVEGGASYNVNI